MKFKVYEYDIVDDNGETYKGSYTIKESVNPIGYPNEQLVDTFSI